MEAIIDVHLISSNKQAVSEDHVQEFVELLEQGWKPPRVVVRRTGATYRLVDGRHRLEAQKRLGQTAVLAWVTL